METTRVALTTPAEPKGNQGCDNEHSDLILYTHDVLFNELTNSSYLVVDKLGQGTFGQVVRCWSHVHRCFVAIKIIKNQAAYHQQAMVEVKILQSLNRGYNADRHNFVRLYEYFRFKNHLCLVFELLQRNLFELIRVSGYQGFSLSLVKHFIKQILQTLMVLRQERVIHGDLKPENVLMEDEKSGLVKVIDFGSSCMEHETVYSYIQSRFYRSPEVVLAYPYDSAIDMWSLGCIAAELYLGLPLFPAASERDLLARMIEILGPFPVRMLEASKRLFRYFRQLPGDFQSEETYQLLTEQEFKQHNHEAAPTARKYFEHSSLQDIIVKSKARSGTALVEDPRCFLDFLLGLLKIDPLKRWNAEQAAGHPFITGALFQGPFHPPPTVPRTVSRPVVIGALSDARFHSASWHPHANAHSIAHEAAMFAVSQITNSVASNSSHLAAGPGSFVPVMGSVPTANGYLTASPETNPVFMAAMVAAREACSNPSCPSAFQTVAQPVAASPGDRRIHGFHVAQTSEASTETSMAFSQGLSFNSNRHSRPMAGINENGPPDEGRELSFDLDLNLPHALESCHLQSSNSTLLEQKRNEPTTTGDAGVHCQWSSVTSQQQFVSPQGTRSGMLPTLFNSGPSQREAAPSVWQLPIASQLQGVSAVSSQTPEQNEPQGVHDCVSRGSLSQHSGLLFSKQSLDNQQQLNQQWRESLSTESSYGTGIYGSSQNSGDQTQLRAQPMMEPPLLNPSEGPRPETPVDEVSSPQSLFPEEFLDGE